MVLRGRPYRNNSIMKLGDIGEGDDALLCITNLTACCRSGGNALGNWYFPNGTIVPSALGVGWDIYTTKDSMVVRMHRRRGGVEGIYCCDIPDTKNVIQTINIGVYSASTGEWSMLFCSTYVQVGEIQARYIMVYGSTPYVGMTPKKNGGNIKSAQMTHSKCLR